MSNFTIDALNKGDILLFKGNKKQAISYAIMLFTNSDVSHAALYLGDRFMAEEGLSGLGKQEIQESPKGDYVYANRLSDKSLVMDPVVKAAEGYLEAGQPYSKSSLVMLAMIILYKKFSPPSATKRIVTRIFVRAAEKIVDMINKRKYPGKTPMICSQFVYQCYQDCGKPYSLKINNGTVLNARLADLRQSDAQTGDKSQDSTTILDRAIESYANGQVVVNNTFSASDDLNDVSDEILAQKLIESLDEPEKIPLTVQLETIDQELDSATIELCKAMAQYHTPDTSKTENALLFARDHASHFVTPADLKNSCTNVSTAGVVNVIRKNS
ncbi:hypothetical protein CHISP_1454 [Chitinispirillum alkaliphilum]|nr:hypothetical protein CHISP_1454 [Chitinispirillum alkaliphilum]